MGRGPRIQFEGALYHIINRGNYRRPIFGHPKTAAAFEGCLFEMCREMDWRLHAYVIMRNHFHLAAETPRANLAQGMQWLESTFAKRFNRFRKERGHLFQDRYKALLIEPGPSLLRVVDYIHLNPVRAKVVPSERLGDFRQGSFQWFRQRERPWFFSCERWLHELGLRDTPGDWATYQEVLQIIALDPRHHDERDRLSRGWMIGSAQWGRAIARQHRGTLRLHQPGGKEWASLQQTQWANSLEELLAIAGRTLGEAARDRRGAPWKITLARELRRTTSATIPWIARVLHLGAPKSLSVYLSRLRTN